VADRPERVAFATADPMRPMGADAEAVTVTVYATVDGVRATARWSSGSVDGDHLLIGGFADPIADPMAFIHECERVAGGTVGVAVGHLADTT
jgi:hypothetical protein